jgi:hypothetical protein
VPVAHLVLHLAQLLLAVGLEGRVLEREEPVVDRLGQHLVLDRVVHEAARQVELAHGAARPADDLGRQHVVDAQLGGDAGHHGVDADAVGVGELGEVAEAHEHLGLGVPATRLVEAPERLGEAEAERVEDRIEHVRARRPPPRPRGCARASRAPRRSRGSPRPAVQLRQQVEVLALTLSRRSTPAASASRIVSGSKVSMLTA